MAACRFAFVLPVPKEKLRSVADLCHDAFTTGASDWMMTGLTNLLLAAPCMPHHRNEKRGSATSRQRVQLSSRFGLRLSLGVGGAPAPARGDRLGLLLAAHGTSSDRLDAVGLCILKPYLVGKVKHMKGEETLRHARSYLDVIEVFTL